MCRAPVQISLISLSRRRSSAGRCNDHGAIMAALTEIRHCFPCRVEQQWEDNADDDEQRRGEPKWRGDREQREGKIKRCPYTHTHTHTQRKKERSRGGKMRARRPLGRISSLLSPLFLFVFTYLLLPRSVFASIRRREIADITAGSGS